MLLAVLITAQAFAQDRIAPIPKKDLDVRVWTNKAEGKSYGQGEHIIVYFQANRDCYVTIYNLDTRGNVNLLFPMEDGEPNYIEGGKVYTIPDYYDEYELMVEGPLGTEYIQAVASLDWYEVPPWPSRFFEYEDYRPLHSDREPVEFLSHVNRRYFPIDHCSGRCATDYTYFEIRRNWEYDWDDYYGTDIYPYPHYRYAHYDPWDWCGTVYIGYPYSGEVWINGIFYGYAPLFIPRIVIGWHHISIWYNNCWWYDNRVQINSGVWYDYTYDDIRYKDDPKRYKFKPGRRASNDVVGERFRPDRRSKVYTKDQGYVSKDVYRKTFEKKHVSKTVSPYFKKKTDRGVKKYGSEGKSITTGPSRSGSATDRDSWRKESPKKKTDNYRNPERIGKSGESVKQGSVKKSDRARSGTYFGGNKVKKSSGSKGSGSVKTSEPIFKPNKGSDKSSGSTKVKSDGSKKSSGSKKIKSNGSTKSGSSGSKSSSGYSAPRQTSVKSSGGSVSKGGSRSSGSKGSSGGKKGGRK
jgi:hypothetical protein